MDYPANEIGLRKALNDVINYQFIANMEPGAIRWLTDDDCKAQVHEWVRKRFRQVTGGHELPKHLANVGDIARKRESLRKDGYESLRDGKVICTERDGPRLMGMEEDVGAVVYAYLGFNAVAERVLTKIGYTKQELNGYLADKRQQHNPKLLAHTPGGRKEESAYLERWQHILRAGREWFEPTKELHDWIESEFAYLAPEFPKLRTR